MRDSNHEYGRSGTQPQKTAQNIVALKKQQPKTARLFPSNIQVSLFTRSLNTSKILQVKLL